MHTADLYQLFLQYPLVCTDTRQIRPESLFFALKGANFNGNSFAGQALASGAKYAVVDEAAYATDDRCILVEDVLTTLQELATYHRAQLTIPVIGVTGTNGKTTTKELLYAVLSQKYKTYATRGNLNNHIGVPLSLLEVDASYEMAIIEMGANHVGEIAALCAIARPTHGLITNVGKAHLEGFGSFDGVKRAKGELYDYIRHAGGVLFAQGDNPHLARMLVECDIAPERIIRYGMDSQHPIHGQLLHADPFLEVEWCSREEGQRHQVKTQLTGSYNLENVLAAIAVGRHFGLQASEINRGIARYCPQNNRSQITKTDRNTVIADFYNANASSMAAALDNMATLTAPHKALVLGDMFELGDDSFEEHARVVAKAKSLGMDRLIFVGNEFAKHRDAEAEYYETTDAARAAMASIRDSLVLLKASRGMAFEQLLALL